MLSRRLNMDIEPNRLSLLLRRKQSADEKIIDLTVSNPTILEFKYNKKEILKAISDENLLNYITDPKGLLSARKDICNYYSDKGVKVDPESVFIVPSTSEAYSYIFKLLIDPDDEIMVPQPCYPLFEFLAELDCGKVVCYPLMYDFKNGWTPDYKVINKLIGPRSKAIVIVNPNNPTGSYLRNEDAEKFSDMCLRHDIAIISDEVFSDFTVEPNDDIFKTFAGNNKALTFVLNGFSKLIALPQLKFGWIVVCGQATHLDEAIQKLEIITDTYLSVGTPVQLAAGKLLETRDDIQTQMIERLRKNYSMLKGRLLLNPDVKVLKCEGGWNAVISFGNLLIPEEEFVCRLLDKTNVFIHPGYYYDFLNEGYAVISLLTEPEVFEEGIDLITRFITAGI